MIPCEFCEKKVRKKFRVVLMRRVYCSTTCRDAHLVTRAFTVPHPQCFARDCVKLRVLPRLLCVECQKASNAYW